MSLPTEGLAALVPILVVEDEPAVLRVILRTLSSTRFDVHAASSGQEALEGLVAGTIPRPQIVVVDYGLPLMSGLDFCVLLMGRDPEVRALLLSGYGASEIEQREGAPLRLPLLQKPFSPDALRATVESLLSTSGGFAPR